MHKAHACMQIMDESGKRAIVVQREGLPDAVVWNPWIDKAAGMADFGDEEYQARLSSRHHPVKAHASISC